MSNYVARDVLTVAMVTKDGQSFEDLGIIERKAGQLIIKCQGYEQLSPSQEALCARIDELCSEVERLRAEQVYWELGNCPSCPNVVSLQEALERNAKLFEAATKWMAKAAHFEAESTKLRGELADAPKCETCEAMLDCDECLRANDSQKERKRIACENVKLRELVDELYPLADYGAMDVSELDRAHDLMRELGIEVD